MEIKLWKQFLKRHNSSKYVNYAPDKDINDAVLMDSTSILHPRIRIRDTGATYNYCYIPGWQRYYFINDIEYFRGFITLSLDVDVLATCHDKINEYTCMVGRAFSAKDPNLVDTLYPPEQGVKILETVVNSQFSEPEEYMLQVNSKEGLQLILMNDTQYRTLCRNLWSTWGSISGMTDVWKNIVDPAQYIVGVQKVAGNPFVFWTQNEKVTGDLPLGDMNIPVGGYYFRVYGEGFMSTTIKIPKHPLASTTPFVKSAAFSSYSIRIPGCGWVPLEADTLYNATELTVIMRGDPLTGNVKVTINVGNKTIAAVTGQLSAPYSLGSSSVSVTGAASSAISTVGGIAAGVATGGWAGVAAGVGAASMGVVSAAELARPTVTMSGSAGGILEVDQPFVVQLKYRTPHSWNPEDQGYPLMQIYQLSLLQGYVRTVAAAFGGADTQEENALVNSFLNGGFYNE